MDKRETKRHVLYHNDKGVVIGMAHETRISTPVERIPGGEVHQTIRAVSGIKSDIETQIDQQTYDRIVDPTDPLAPTDFNR